MPFGKPQRRHFLGGGDIAVSFEFYPPKTPAMEAILWRAIRRLEPLSPVDISVTYGAGEATRQRTHATIARILTETTMKPAANLTCVSATRADVDEIARDYWSRGVRHIVALRGDPAEGVGTRYRPTPGGYRDAAHLIKGIREIAPFQISVAAHPEKHPDSPSVMVDLDRLKAKIDAGATNAITQFFFDNRVYFDFVERARTAGISIPIIPGIIPIHDFHHIARFAANAGIAVPKWLARRFDGLDHDPQTRRLAAAALAAEQVLGLVDHGITRFHFYTLNRADLVYAICHMLGLRPAKAQCEMATAP
jgi:methylenetetrahydrofolate reductase (NADPH)